jgi:aminopeptidase
VSAAFEARLDALARVALAVGVDLPPGGRLQVTAPLEAAPLVRRVVTQAYELGATYVDARYVDGHVARARALHAREDTLDFYPSEHAAFATAVARRGDATIHVSGADPDLMADADPVRLRRINRANREALREVTELGMRTFMPWTIIAAATPGWARKVFPGLPEDEAVARLWDAIFAATRVDGPDPVAAWRAHAATLDARAAQLSALEFHALHLRGPGTDLRVGLADGHVWEGATAVAAVNARRIVANMPTEEVFTVPHARRVEGTLRATKPLSYQSQLIDGFSLTFEDGAVVDFAAERGERALRELLSTDEGCRRLGEIALVPHSSPISRSGLLFYNTLFDENAACHVALGRSYPTGLREGLTRSADDLERAGMNRSLLHVDFMVGSAELDIDGVVADGATVPVMRGGEWAIQ